MRQSKAVKNGLDLGKELDKPMASREYNVEVEEKKAIDGAEHILMCVIECGLATLSRSMSSKKLLP